MMGSSEERCNASDFQVVAEDSVIQDVFPSSSAIKKILERDQLLVYKGNGTSMLPMLRPDRDMVVFVPVKERLKKYDVALYMRGKKHIVHRVIKVQESGYLIRGDNTFIMETVLEKDVIGVLTCFFRDGRQYHVSHRGYRCYTRLWCALYPVRWMMKKMYTKAKSVLRRLEITSNRNAK